MKSRELRAAILASGSVLASFLDHYGFVASQAGTRYQRRIGEITQTIELIVQKSPNDCSDAIAAIDPWLAITYHSIESDLASINACLVFPPIDATQRFPLSALSKGTPLRRLARTKNELGAAITSLRGDLQKHALPYLDSRRNPDEVVAEWKNEPSYIKTDSAQAIRIALLLLHNSGSATSISMLQAHLSKETKIRRYKPVFDFISRQLI